MKCDTVKINDGNDSYIVINASDFDESEHEIYEEKEGPKEGTKDYLKVKLTEMGVEFSEDDKKADLEELYEIALEEAK